MISLLAFKLDERSKKVLLVLLALFIIILLVFGAIYFFISKYMKHEAQKMDAYMYDVCDFRLVENPHQFREAVSYYERRSLFNNSKWPFRIAIVLTGIIILLGTVALKGRLGDLFTKVADIFPILEYQTVGKINDIIEKAGETAKINMPRWMPASIFPTIISKNPDFSDIALWISCVYYLLMLILFFKLLGAILGYIARKRRARTMSVEVFKKKLDNLTINHNEEFKKNLEDISNQDKE